MQALLESRHESMASRYLSSARIHRSQAEIASYLGVSKRTVQRWEARQNDPPPYIVHALQQLLPFQIPLSASAAFRFVDLFAGIGGLRLPFDELGGSCVFTSEWDNYAQKTYSENFRSTHILHGDIRSIAEEAIPDHDLLVGGFPCQPFSIAGVSKKNALGRAHGFLDETQGTLFFDVARIIKAKRPRAFVLENVKNLQSHDKGRTFEVIRRTLSEELGYDLHYRIIDGAHFVPQRRERIILVGFREPTPFDWSIIRLPERGAIRLESVLHRTDGTEPILEWDEGRYFDHSTRTVPARYTLTPHLWRYLQDYKAKHEAKGNGFGFGLVGPGDIARTLSARYYKDGSEILVDQGRDLPPRRLTPRECARLMGFPDSFRIPVSDTRAYKQFGNAVIVPVVREVARAVCHFLMREEQAQPDLLVRAM